MTLTYISKPSVTLTYISKSSVTLTYISKPSVTLTYISKPSVLHEGSELRLLESLAAKSAQGIGFGNVPVGHEDTRIAPNLELLLERIEVNDGVQLLVIQFVEDGPSDLRHSSKLHFAYLKSLFVLIFRRHLWSKIYL